MTCRAAARLAALLVAGAALVPVAPLSTLPAAADPADDLVCLGLEPDTEVGAEAESVSRPLVQVQVPAAQRLLERRGTQPGEDWAIAVLDSGVVHGVDVEAVYPGGGAPPVDYHGTVVANLAAGAPRPDGGLVGVAPGARVLDIRVFDEQEDPSGAPPGVNMDRLIEGLEWVVARARSGEGTRIAVAVVAHWMERDADLRRAIDKVLAEDIVVVAATGNRPGEGERNYDKIEVDEAGRPLPGEDVADLVQPAGYPGVLGVGATADGSTADLRAAVLQSSAIDVVVPTAGAVSRGLNGQSCVLAGDENVATSWAAAEVAGVVAMLRSAHPDETRQQIEARLLHTANGVADRPSVLTGAGVVQSLEAIARPLSPAPDGTVVAPSPAAEIRPATAPAPRTDVLVEPRRRAVWAGLIGGGVVLLAVVLRPLLARRRGA
ncbi:S8 family serine peptidase [Nocardioides ferulae]|uniref:S8 family serine peptidase n=1 Tax=Nocardioides ferulae TaxID=2340821 RepID=UPI0013DDD004|nr:S8 family serine peptidase [Nocardioides ferulae]